MPNEPKEQLKRLLHNSHEIRHSVKSKEKFRILFLSEFEHPSKIGGCSLEIFGIYFLNAVRHNTEIHLRGIESEFPKCQTPVFSGKSTAEIGETTTLTPKRNPLSTHNLSTSTPTPTFASTPELHKESDSRVFAVDHFLWDESLLNCSTVKRSSSINSVTPNQSQPFECIVSQSLQSESSTPIRNTRGNGNQNNSRRFASSLNVITPNSVEKHGRSNSASSSFCLGDFIVLQSSNNRSNRKKTLQSHATQATILESSSKSKPKKRVVPTTINNRADVSGSNESKPFDGSSSFSNENNILKISNVEIEDKDKCSIMAARRSLKLNADEISKEMQTTKCVEEENKIRDIIEKKVTNAPKVTLKKIDSTDAMAELPSVNFDLVDDQISLQILAAIYNVLMDLNFVTNILNELAFLLNLLNIKQHSSEAVCSGTDETQTSGTSSAATQVMYGMHLLKNPTNCIYFALNVLQEQMHLFALLDSKSIKVVLYNERIWSLDTELKTYIESIYQRKQLLEGDKHHATDLGKSFKNVYYQEDKDSRQHFTTNNEFGAYKTQRDLFYKIMKLWETHHLNPMWNVAQELAPKIREIFKQSEHPVNMTHFAKLFVSQLLISASDTTSPEEMGLEVDAQKFSKLTQRLIAPSNFSVDYQFPRNQAFFRDFICEARSIPFNEQLKIALYSQLISLNDSTFEQLNVPIASEKESDELEIEAAEYEYNEIIVRPEVLSSMLILAKFLGFVTALPYKQNNYTNMPPSLEKKQIMLRSLFQPHFNVCHHLRDAIKNNKIVITLPWLVQYLAMLDNITLQLESFIEATQLLFALYMNLGVEVGYSSLAPTSIFILRCCLGWLFDTKPLIAEQYFSYRSTNVGKLTPLSKATKNVQTMQLLVTKELSTTLQINTEDNNNSSEVSCTNSLKQIKTAASDYHVTPKRINHLEQHFNPMLESLLPVACPFLAEFRVSIMPSKHATMKYVSRTGRYRHITTSVTDPQNKTINTPSNNNSTSDITNVQQSQQNKLIEAFLHSQNASMRRLIEFITDRTYKSVVKDGQNKYVLPLKGTADMEVNKITSCIEEEVYKNVSSLYERAQKTAQEQWLLNIPHMLEDRITKALTALLPTATEPIIRQTYFILIQRNATQKIQQWYQANLGRNNYYCGDLNEVTIKICKANEKTCLSAGGSELKIRKMEPSVSDMLDELQYWLHCTSLRNELLTTAEEILIFLQRLPSVFSNTLPTIFYRLTGAGIVQLLQHIIIQKPEYMTTDVIAAACKIWKCSEMQKAINTSKTSNSNNDINYPVGKESNRGANITENLAIPCIYDGLITVPFIESLSTYRMRYDKLYDLLTAMIKQCVLSVEKVNLLFVPIFKESWSASVLNEISRILQNIAAGAAMLRSTVSGDNTGSGLDEAKSHLFMEVLADFSRDVDDF